MEYSPPGSSVHGDSPGKNTGVDCHAILQGIFPTQESNQGLLLCRRILYQLSYPGSPAPCLCLNNYILCYWAPQVMLVVKNLPANAGDIRDVGLVNPWIGKIPWRRAWQPAPVFLRREFYGQRSQAGYSP